ncbi:MAG TPA: phosphoglucosamine mutase [Solirubrobacteraceae bacterium]|jgi:phosphoglucosamine mutase|nr:phosphoglucosamine mutase [Solirubrobacteraceae bacterium]
MSGSVGRLFGTDGVRGVAGEEITASLALSLGRIATLGCGVPRPRVFVIRDTRESGEMLESAIAAGVADAGGEVLLGGVLPTPAAPLMIRRYGFDLAAVISASHNSYEDNGIKFFASDGFKLSDADELEIERRLDDPSFRGPVGSSPDVGRAGRGIGRIRQLRGAADDYLRELELRFRDLSLDGVDVLLDCANGATYKVAPEIFRRLGAKVTAIANQPDGRNINDGCGSTHVEALCASVRSGGHDIGFAFDGDGDRLLAVDRTGRVVDGDELLALSAVHLRRHGRLTGDGVAVTVMTNYGFHSAMADAGIEVAVTDVGDRYVLEALRERGWALGGEQSGHIIDLGFAPSGDGIAAALLALEALAGEDLSRPAAMEKLPQQLINVRVRDRTALDDAARVHAAIADEAASLLGRGRVLVRRSGTEPLVRVMVEAPSSEETTDVCGRLASLIETELS